MKKKRVGIWPQLGIYFMLPPAVAGSANLKPGDKAMSKFITKMLSGLMSRSPAHHRRSNRARLSVLTLEARDVPSASQMITNSHNSNVSLSASNPAQVRQLSQSIMQINQSVVQLRAMAANPGLSLSRHFG